MAIAKRCKFCGHKLDSKGYCRNAECADYERTKTMGKQEPIEKKEQVTR